MEKRELAFELYKSSDGAKPLIDIANEVESSPGSVRGWKSRYKWDEQIGKDPAETKRNVTKKERSATRNVTKVKETPKAVIELNDNDELNDKQKLFCLYYLQSFNATQAYIKAYGCDYATAMVNASRLLRNAKVKSELDRLRVELQSEQYFTVQDIINDYAKQWRSDIKDVVTVNLTEYELKNKGGHILTGEDGNPVIAHYNEVIVNPSDHFDGSMVKKISQGKDGISVEMYDSQRAMAELVKLLPNAALRKLEAEALILENKADKLTNDSQVDELLHALLNPMLAETSEVVADDTVQSEAD